MKEYVVGYGGERLDRIARKVYGTEKGGTVEVLLDANPGLSMCWPVVPEGRVIKVPVQVSTTPSNEYQLAWE